MRRASSLALLSLSLLSLPAAAQVEDPDLGLLAGQLGSAPNVMILVDTSGSTKHVMWADGFNPKLFHNIGSPCSGVSALTVYTDDSLAGQCPSSGSGSNCPANDVNSSQGLQGIETADPSLLNPAGLTTVSCPWANFPRGCDAGAAGAFPASFSCAHVGTSLRITLPDVDKAESASNPSAIDAPDESTYWSPNYIHWLMKRHATRTLPASLPLETRKMAAKRVLRDIINEVNPTVGTTTEQRVRFGLARMHGSGATFPTAGDWNGGFVVEPIADNNKTALLSALRGNKITAPGLARTTLSESLVDMGRYFAGSLNPGGKGLGSYPIYDRNVTDGGSAGSSPASPIVPSIGCRQNFVIVVTDGQPTEDANNHFSNGNTYQQTFGASGGAPDALTRVAGYLAQNDLIDDTVMPEVQNVVTYTIGLTLDVQLLKDTADAGDGEYFTANSASGLADHLRTSLQDIVLRSGSFTAAAVPATRSAFGDGFYTTFFEPQRRGELYTGHLQAFRIDENFDIVGTDPDTSALDPVTGQFVEPRLFFWDSALTLANPANLPRKLYVTPPGGAATNAFTTANLTAAHLNVTSADLPKYVSPPSAPISNAEGLADALVKYVSGEDRFDADLDNNVTELRQTVLGDIFHSSPRVVGPPPFSMLSEPGYAQPLGDPNTFLVRYGQREKLIYAGANDGMLHAFNAGNFQTGDNPLTADETESAYYDMGTGIEKFGWVPRSVLPTLKQITLPGPHPLYVDGAITVADAWFPRNASDTDKDVDEWTTALVVGLRNGGEAYLALDVTDPSVTDPNAPHGPFPKLLWELNDPNEPLGRTWSRAVITRVKLRGSHGDDFCGPSNGDGMSGVGQPGNCREEWVAIFGAGYLEQGDPSATQFLSDPNAAGWDDDSKGIFMVSLATGAVLARVSYQAGTGPLAQMKYAFPSEPAVLDLNFDGFADVIYIGDTGGQLWKWDISATGVRDVTGRVPTSVWPANRFFVAPQASNGHRRSFFYPPTASFAGGKLVLGIGTGERTNAGYRTLGGDENRYYVIQDVNPTGVNAFAGTPLGESNLTLLAPNGVDTNSTDSGFYLIGDRDEKFISDSLAFGGFVVTASYVPKPPNPLAPCEGGGESILYIFSLSTGAGFFPSGEPGRIDSRRVTLGSGLPSSASITVSGDRARITLQTSDNAVKSREAPAPNETPVDLIYWHQK